MNGCMRKMHTTIFVTERGMHMPYKIIMWKMNTEIPEIHYIHAENTRVAKRKALRYMLSGILLRKIEYVRMTEILVQEECGIFED